MKLYLSALLIVPMLSACGSKNSSEGQTSQGLYTQSNKTIVAPSRVRGLASLNVKNYGALGNGINDDTAKIQKAVDALPVAGGTVVIPAGTYVIDPTVNVRLRSNMHLKLDPNAKLIAKRNAEERAYVLMAMKVNNLEISGGKIEGDRYRHLGTTGEWGHGIMIRGSSEVTVRDIHISDCWGDGISIGSAMGLPGEPYQESSDIVISNIVSTNNRRQAVTVGGSKKVRIYDSELSYSNGALPEAGIDIEPDPVSLQSANAVHIENCDIKNNAGNGIQIYKEVQGVTIRNNRLDYNGGHGLFTLETTGGYITGNQIRHNYLEGFMLRRDTVSYQISGNVFRNNKTRLRGVTNDTNALSSIVGLVGGNKGNGAHILVDAATTSDIRVTTNQYAK